MEIFGLAVAILFHHAFSLFLMVVFFWRNADTAEAFVPFDKECLGLIRTYVSIGTPTVLMLMISWWAFEFMVLAAGLIGVIE